MYCSKCGNQLDDKAVVCTKCGCIANSELYHAAFNAAQQKNDMESTEISVSDVQNNNQGNSLNNTPVSVNNTNSNNNNIEDKPVAGFSILSFFIPLFGIIIFCAEHKTKPIASKRYLLWSIVSIALAILFTLAFFVTMILMVTVMPIDLLPIQPK